jgi:hypothetical protein
MGCLGPCVQDSEGAGGSRAVEEVVGLGSEDPGNSIALDSVSRARRRCLAVFAELMKNAAGSSDHRRSWVRGSSRVVKGVDGWSRWRSRASS